MQRSSVSRAVLGFTLSGLLVLVLVGFLGVLGLRRIATAEAMDEARDLTRVAGRGIVQPRLRDSIVRGDAAALTELDAIVNQTVLLDPIVRVKLWRADGRIVYSDVPELIGSTFELGADQREVLRTNGIEAELSDLSGPENRYEAPFGELLEVYLPVRAPDGTPLLFETYQRRSEVAATGRRLWIPFAALLLGSLVLLWAVQVPLAWRLGRRLQRTQADREALLVRAVEASDDERRRIAADLHDGPVQDLAGISYSLSAAAERETSAATRATLRDAAAGTREAMRRLRTLLVEIHPPNLRATGLEPALRDLLAPLAASGVATSLIVDPEAELDDEGERLVYRAAAEALRNVQRHAAASRVDVSVRTINDGVRLEVADDGVGFTPGDRERRLAEGHVGLSLLEQLASSAGAVVEVRSSPGGGTCVALEVPRR